MNEGIQTRKLIVYDMELIQNVLNIVKELKTENIDESRKQIAIYDALDQNFIQVLDAEPQQPQQPPFQIEKAEPAAEEMTKDPAMQKPPIVIMNENGESEEENWDEENSDSCSDEN